MTGGEAGGGTSGSGKGGWFEALGGLSFGSGGSFDTSWTAPISLICISSELGYRFKSRFGKSVDSKVWRASSRAAASG